MNTVYQIWIIFLTFVTAVTLAPGIAVQDGLKGYLVGGVIFVSIIMFLPRFIEFFKINVNFWSFLVFGMFLTVGYFFFMRYVLIGFLTFEEITGSEAFMGIPFLRGFNFSETWVTCFAGIFSIFLVSFTQWLMGK